MNAKETPDFKISSNGDVSREFLNRNILTFLKAANYVSTLPYGRNVNKSDLSSLFRDGCGTCSTKHALLKQLAVENNFSELKLILGIFRMNAKNNPRTANTLKQEGLDYIPEAHCYLKRRNAILDFTRERADPSDFVNDILEEVEISPDQITDYKVSYHKKYMQQWLDQNRHITFTLEELWNIREQCIRDLCRK